MKRAADILAITAGAAIGLVGAVTLAAWGTALLAQAANRRWERRAIGGAR